MKKIMFDDHFGLTQAVLEGRKTMTRRVITIPEKWHGIEVYGFCRVKGQASLELTDGDDFCIEDTRTGQCAQILPIYRIGEEVAVAQSYREIEKEIMREGLPLTIKDGLFKSPGYRNKMFVRADLMPHQIRITSVRVERIQDISEDDCLREGIIDGKVELKLYGFKNGKHYDTAHTPREAFAILIKKMAGKKTWDDNPWVFVYEFELVK